MSNSRTRRTELKHRKGQARVKARRRARTARSASSRVRVSPTTR